jgi:hypothetical protein
MQMTYRGAAAAIAARFRYGDRAEGDDEGGSGGGSGVHDAPDGRA